jgi:hypothetical protein
VNGDFFQDRPFVNVPVIWIHVHEVLKCISESQNKKKIKNTSKKLLRFEKTISKQKQKTARYYCNFRKSEKRHNYKNIKNGLAYIP